MQKYIITSLSFTIIPISLTYLIKQIYQKFGSKLNCKDTYLYKFIFVTFRNRVCAPHLNTHIECSSKCSFRYLQSVINLINSAEKTLSICIYHLTLDQISKAIIQAKERGVKIRCITDNVMISCTGSKWPNIKKAGIPIKIQMNNLKNSLVHHKFIIIDENDPDNCKVMFGSLNYTMQGFVNNCDHTICTNNIEILQRFKEEFDELWEEFEFL